MSRPKGDEPVWLFDYRYPDEPKANSQETVTLGTDGTTLNGERVVGRTSVPGERLKVVTEESGMDNDRAAVREGATVLDASGDQPVLASEQLVADERTGTRP